MEHKGLYFLLYVCTILCIWVINGIQVPDLYTSICVELVECHL